MAFIRRNRKKLCQMCQNHIEHIDYKDVEFLRNYVNAIGKIQPQRITGACTSHQRRVANAIKRSRIVALLPFIKE